MSGLWTVKTMARVTGGQIAGPAPDSVSGVSIDSRTVAPGEAFFAIEGDRFDGHDFAGAALQAGAGLAVVEATKVPALGAPDGCLLVVPDVMDALRDLARAARQRSHAKFVAVTGSVGKTGTKEALRLALSTCGKTHASVKSFNNHWGVPLTLARMAEDTDFGVFEIGMNHAGEITPLSQMVRPQVAMVTTVAAVHLGFFDSVRGIAEAKSEIFTGLTAEGTAIVPADNEFRDLLIDRARTSGALRIVTFGTSAGADVRLLDVSAEDGASRVTADILGRTVSYLLTVPGRHWVANSLAVIAALDALDLDMDVALDALAQLSAPRGRGETHRFKLGEGTLTVIDESYNANPASMAAALAVLGDTPVGSGGRRIAVLGDMLELGATGPGLHMELADPIADAGTDLVFASGPLMEGLFAILSKDRQGEYYEKPEGLVDPLLGALRAGDVVMVKGSLGSRMGPIVEAIKSHFEMSEDAPANDSA